MKRSHRLQRGATYAAVVCLMVVLHQPSSAQLQPNEWNPTLPEVLQLPQYCQGVFRKDLDKPPNAIAMCGGWFNHFCPALVSLNRAGQVTRPMTERRYFLANANQHLAYTRKHLSPTCPLAEALRASEARAKIMSITVK